ncbi:pheromone autoinducer 2 transporter [uncultured Clostridium sp.]|nr:pheromone autoinducer 2 transporter [uncultured Clostridium sp.]
MNKIKDELYKSIKYVIPIVLIFIGILILKHFSSISNFIAINLSNISDLLAPFFIGFVIAYILNQPLKILENKFKLKRPISLAIVYGFVIAVIIFSWLFIIPVIKSNINDIYAYIPQGVDSIQEFINNLSTNYKFNINNQEIKLQINDFITNILLPLSTSTASILSEMIINTTSTIVSYVFNVFLGIVISVYLLLSKEKCINVINILSKKLLKKYYLVVKEFVNVLDKNIGVYIVAKATDSTIYSVICIIILSIVGSKYALFLGIIAGITNMIPFFGPIIGTVVAVVVNLFFSLDKAIVVLIVMIIVQQLESAVLEPFFVGKQVGVPPIFTILAVTFASKYTGFIGILLSVPITGVLLMYANRFIKKETDLTS